MNLDLKALSEQGNLHSKYTLSIEKFCLSILECMCRRIYRQLMAWLGTCMFVNACAEFLTAATKTWKNEEESFLDPETIQKGKPKEKWGINNQSLKMTLCLSYQQAETHARFLWHVMYLSRFLSITSLVDEKELAFYIVHSLALHSRHK